MKHEAQVFEIASQSCIINQEQQKKIIIFSNYWLLLSNILAVSQVFEDCHCLKQNTYTFLDLNSVILIEIWRCQVFGKPKQPKNRLMWFKTGYPSPLITKINGLMEYSKSGKGSVSIHCRGPWFIKKL